MANNDPTGSVQFVVKNSSRPQLPDFNLAVAIDSTVADVKAKIRQEYDGHPEVGAQTVRYLLRALLNTFSSYLTALIPVCFIQIIYAGKVLKGDAVRVGDFINKVCSYHVSVLAYRCLCV